MLKSIKGSVSITAAVVFMICSTFCVLAADVSDLYQTVVPPSNTRDSAFPEALRMVAVKVSGSRDAAAKFTAPMPDLRRYVQKIQTVGNDGSVLVGFDPAAIDSLLTKAALPLWGRERPAVLVWLSMPDASGKPNWVSSDQSSPDRDTVDRVAQTRGLPVLWPSMDAADLTTVANLVTARGSSAELLASAERYRADAVLLGTATRDATGSVTVQWSFAIGGGAKEEAIVMTQTSLEEGVQLAADRCAGLFAVPSNVLTDVLVQIVGIHNLDAYAGAINYLQGFTVVTNVAVEQINGDVMRVRVAVRGNNATLRHAIELKRRVAALVVDSTASATDDNLLRLRYLQ
ncbi:MAG TPA: DUF2066 domain-containing protein [Steroidobacteraceae bacterium]|nr:DUF2066 domain-containing protein [Steroidobacteraceae bacterium]